MRRACLLVAVAVSCFVTVISSQQAQPPPVFRSRVDLVVLDVSVLDSDRRPVRGLAAADFTVLEDGKPQKVTMFSAVDMPDVEDSAPAPWMRDVAADVRSNEEDAASQIFLLVMDDANTMELADVPYAKRYAKSVIDRLGPRDLAAVIFLADARSGQELTHDRARLRAAVERFNVQVPGDPIKGALEMMGGQMALSTLKAQAESLLALPSARKTLIFITAKGVEVPDQFVRNLAEAINEGDADVAGMNAQTLGDFGQYLRAAQRANLTVYCVDPGGLRAPGLNSRAKYVENPMPLGTSLGLQALAAVTGGFAVLHTNDPEPGITQVFRENRSYYLLAYASSNSRTEGRFREVQIKVNRPDVTVRTRTGYFESEPPKKNKVAADRAVPLDAALAGIVAVTDLPMRVAAAPFAIPGQRDASVAVVLGLRDEAPAAAARSGAYEIAVNAYDYTAKLRGSDRFNVRTAIKPGQAQEVGLEAMARLALPPGRYHVRVAARETASTGDRAKAGRPPKSGSVFCDLDVPDFAGAPLSLSGVVLNVSPPLSFAARERLASMLPIVPTTLRQFFSADSVMAYLRVYQGGGKPFQPVTMAIRVTDAASKVVIARSEDLTTTDFSTDRSAEYMRPLPIRDLPAGEYLLTVEARTAEHAARRDVRFSIR